MAESMFAPTSHMPVVGAYQHAFNNAFSDIVLSSQKIFLNGWRPWWLVLLHTNIFLQGHNTLCLSRRFCDWYVG
jgi:hypothetical protein